VPGGRLSLPCITWLIHADGHSGLLHEASLLAVDIGGSGFCKPPAFFFFALTVLLF